MKMRLIIFLIEFLNFLCLYEATVIKTDWSEKPKDDRELINRDHVRRKRFLGLSRKFKLNKRYQECVGPGDAKGHCKHLIFCPIDVLRGTQSSLEYLCVIQRTFVGVCCPDDVALSSMVGSQLIMDLPAGGEDYEDNDNVTGCGIPAEGRSILSPTSIRVQEWPWLVGLYDKNDLNSGSMVKPFCGGALITDTHVLTAAHCFQSISPQDVRVRLGEYDFSKTNETRSQDYAAAEVIMHEDFELSTYENDIAIVRLPQPTSFNTYIWPLCLPPSEETFENETVLIAGWGKTAFNGNPSDVLLQVTVPVWQLEKCADSFLQRITDNNICAAAYEGGKDSCQGDSGGPLMYQLKNGRWVTIGIVSWGISCGNPGSPGIYTRVNKYLPWIITHTIAKQEIKLQ